MEFLWFYSNPPANAQTAPSSGNYYSLRVLPQLIIPSSGLPPTTPPSTQRHRHATKHTPSAQATSHATSHSDTLTRHKAHSSSQATSSSLTQNTHHILWNPQVHYNVRKNSPWASSVQSTRSHPNSVTSILLLSCHLRLDFQSVYFLGVSSRKLKMHLSTPSCVPHDHKSHHPWFAHTSNIQWHSVREASRYQMFSGFFCFLPFKHKHLPHHHIL